MAKQIFRNTDDDQKWMQLAFDQALIANRKLEVPVGAVIICDGKVVAKGHNIKECRHTSLGHAELVAIYRAQQKLGRWRLNDCTLYSTLEPCIMCAGAIQQARLQRLVFAAPDAKGGGVQGIYRLLSDDRTNHQVPFQMGPMTSESQSLLKQFFREERLRKKRT